MKKKKKTIVICIIQYSVKIFHYKKKKEKYFSAKQDTDRNIAQP